MTRARGDRAERSAAIVLTVERCSPTGDHALGDDLPRVGEDRLRASIGPRDTLARVGGAEFTVMCDGVGESGHAVALTTRLIAAVTAPIVRRAGVLHDGTRRGSRSPLQVRPRRVSPARRRSRCVTLRIGVEVFGASIGIAGVADPRNDSDLRRGFEEGELRVAFQPLVSSSDRAVVGVESLVRWEHPTRGELVPARLLPLAEQSGLITRIVAWILSEACRQAAT